MTAAFVALTSGVLTACVGEGSSAGSSGDGTGSAGEGRSPAAGAAADGTEGAAPGGPGEAVPGVHGQAPAASGGLPSIVTLTPADGLPELPSEAWAAQPARGDDAVIDQFGLAFSPEVLIVAAGSPVRFTNSEGAITHNVHIRSIAGDSTVFNGDTGPSDGVDVELPGPGAYDVLCDMHPGMTAFVYVTDAPFAVAAGTDGSFRLAPVPPGPYTARVWTATGGLAPERSVTVGDGPTELDLTLSPENTS